MTHESLRHGTTSLLALDASYGGDRVNVNSLKFLAAADRATRTHTVLAG